MKTAKPVHSRNYGEIFIAPPVSASVFAIVCALLVAGLICAMFFISYTRKERVQGQLRSDQGVIKVYAPVNGARLKSKMIRHGDTVKQGQVLFVISLDKSVASGFAVQQSLDQIQRRNLNVRAEQKRLSDIHSNERGLLNQRRAAITQRLQFLEQELIQLDTEITTLIRGLKLAQDHYKQQEKLFREGFVSQTGLGDAERQQLEIETRLSATKRQQTSLRREQLQNQTEASALETEMRNLPQQQANKSSELDRLKSGIEMEILETEGKRELVITAPQDGVISTVLAESGQTLATDTPLAVLLPIDYKLQAHLYLPTRAYGFINEGMPAQLRYQAYPYQKFGLYAGKVTELSKSALSTEELKLAGLMSPEPHYRIIVSLDQQHVRAYGRLVSLQEGMVVEADILVDTRKLYEWILEPLYSVTGKL